MKKYILAIDAGTTSSRAILFDKKGTQIATSQFEFTQIFPKESWVEHDPIEIWETQLKAIKDVVNLAKIGFNEIDSIGITNQRETTVVWNKKTGKPVYNAIVWQDRRTAFICDELNDSGKANIFYDKTGLLLDAYFSGTKIKWILDNVKGARAKAKKGDLLFGTMDTWLIWKLTGGEIHVTDYSNASRTMIYNIKKLEWDAKMLKAMNIPLEMLPEVKPSSKVYGNTLQELFGMEIPIAGIAGDQQSALFGQMCTEPGMVKNTYGTGCFMLMHTGEKAVSSKNNLLTTIALQINGHTYYALEGSVFIGGAVVQWLRDGLHLIRNSSEVEALAKQVEETDGVYLVPAFAGLGAPYWNQHARGTIVGITRGTTSAHIARAALESIAFQSYDLLKAMEADAGIPIAELRVDGGATHNNLLMQFQSDIVNTKVTRPTMVETTALGAAYLAGLAVGFWKDIEELRSKWQIDQTFLPSATAEKRKDWIQGWERAIKATNNW